MSKAEIEARLRLLEEQDKEAEIQDKFQLFAFGLRTKAALIRKRAILDTVTELKRRFRILLHRFIEKREQARFDELQDLILNFDQKPGYKEQFEAELLKQPKLGTFKQPKAAIQAVAMKDEIPLGVVNEEAEDELDNSTQKMTPMVHSSLQSGFASPINKLSLHELSDVKITDSFNRKDQQLSQTKISSEPIESDN